MRLYASTNSGATNISLNRFHLAFHLLGSTFGCTEDAHISTVDVQLQMMLNKVHFNSNKYIKS